MKINDILLEAKVAPIYGYHTTTLNHLRSILKHGLVPNKSDGGYASDEISLVGYDLSALPGVYFFKDSRDAEGLSKDYNTIHNKQSIIIIAKISPQTATLDEDNVVDLIDERSLYKRFTKAIKSGQMPTDIIESGYEYVIHKLEQLLDPRAVRNVQNDIHKYITVLSQFAQEKAENRSDKLDVLGRQLKTIQEILTIKLRRLLQSGRQHEHDTFKVDGPVTFSGANRIVGIYSPEMRAGYGDLGGFERDSYHKYKSPMDLINRKD